MYQNFELLSFFVREVQRGTLGQVLRTAVLSGGSRERVTPGQGIERAERPSRVPRAEPLAGNPMGLAPWHIGELWQY